MITALSHTKQLREMKSAVLTEGGKVNMCKAIDDMIEDAREEGKYDTLKILIKREAISISVAAEVLGVTEEELKQNI